MVVVVVVVSMFQLNIIFPPTKTKLKKSAQRQINGAQAQEDRDEILVCVCSKNTPRDSSDKSSQSLL